MRGNELIIGLPSDFDHLFVGGASFIFCYLEVDIVASSCQPFHYGLVFRDAVFVAAHFVSYV